MRGIILLGALIATLAHAAANDYVEVRDLELDAAGVNGLEIDAGAGSLDVVGEPGADVIAVTATIVVPDRREERAKKRIESDMTLSLEQRGDRALLQSFFESRMFQWGSGAHIALEVRIPARLDLSVDDGAGSIEVYNVHGAIELDDGSGSLSLANVGSVRVDDGSGSIEIDQANGDVRIIDGSGSITVRNVAGSVIVDDGSGGINVSDITADLIIEDDGSGGLRFARIGGSVEQND